MLSSVRRLARLIHLSAVRLLLPIFTAVVVGGTTLGGGRGGCLGSVVGAYIMMIVVNILLVLNVSAYYSTVAEGVILILAVLGTSLRSQFGDISVCASSAPAVDRMAQRNVAESNAVH